MLVAIVRLAGEEFQRILPTWSGDAIHGALIDTVRAYADADMNVLRAAQRLSVHPNTIYLQKIADVTGLDARSFHALTELLIVAGAKTREQQA